ncbi:MFS-type transporter SLC18B1 [Nymphon striatum]|nr:MFS-type transporter SLC18B1 [Nymphon striatum]
MAVMCFGAFSNYLIFSVIAPVFPAEAQRKGLTSTYYTLVFAVHGLIQFAASPLLGKYMITIGCKFMCVWGLVFTAVAATLFGTLQFCEDKWTFFWLAIVLRMFEGFGTCAFFTSAYVYVMRMYPKSPGAAFGTIEMFGSAGYILGPVFGSILLHFGEFWLPMVTTGLILVLNAILATIIVPDAKSDSSDTPQGTKEFFSIPMVIFNYMLILLQTMYLSYFLALTEEHLVTVFKVNLIQVGLFLMVVSILYSMSSPISGYIGDHFYRSAYKGKGKIKALKCTLSSDESCQVFDDLGSEWELSDELFHGLDKCVYLLYSQPTCTNVNMDRYNLFKMRYSSESSLLPNSDSLRHHSTRACYQDAIHQRSLNQIMSAPNSINYGWQLEKGELSYVWMKQPPAPPNVMKTVTVDVSKLGIRINSAHIKEEIYPALRPNSMWMPYIGAFLFGIGSGPLHACTFSKVKQSAVNFLGGSIAGAMMEYLGYDWSNIIYAILFVIMAIVVPIVTRAQKKLELERYKATDYNMPHSETAHLLIGNSESFF